MRIRKLMIAVWICLLSSSLFAANDVVNTQTQNTITQNTVTAKEWGLTDSDWSQYLRLMQGASGQYYKQLSPVQVLGINANNPEELKRYAEIAATQEHDKLERELRFNTAFHTAATRLYASEPIIKPFDYSPFTPIPK